MNEDRTGKLIPLWAGIMMTGVFILSFPLTAATNLGLKVENVSLLVAPLKNFSEYKGKWSIGPGFSGLLVKKLKGQGFRNAEIATRLFSVSNTNTITISGEITKFKFHEYLATAYMIGGYKNYVVDISIKLRIVSRPYNLKTEKDIDYSISKKNYGLALLGGPGGSGDEDVNVYAELQKVPFGSDDYWGTIFGTATKETVEKMADWISDRLNGIK